MIDAAADPAAGVLLQYGAVGVVALLALAAVRVLFTRLTAALDRETQRGDRLEEELRKLNEAVRGEYITTINQSAQATADASRAVADALAAVRLLAFSRELAAEVQELREAGDDDDEGAGGRAAGTADGAGRRTAE